jgi:hypothetical protein
MRGRMGSSGETVNAGLGEGACELAVRAWLHKRLYEVIGRKSVSLERAHSYRNNGLAETIDLTGSTGYTRRGTI